MAQFRVLFRDIVTYEVAVEAATVSEAKRAAMAKVKSGDEGFALNMQDAPGSPYLIGVEKAPELFAGKIKHPTRTENFFLGVDILRSYCKDGPENLEMWSMDNAVGFQYCCLDPLSQEDIQRMLALGWYQSGGATKENPAKYDTKACWRFNL